MASVVAQPSRSWAEVDSTCYLSSAAMFLAAFFFSFSMAIPPENRKNFCAFYSLAQKRQIMRIDKFSFNSYPV